MACLWNTRCGGGGLVSHLLAIPKVTPLQHEMSTVLFNKKNPSSLLIPVLPSSYLANDQLVRLFYFLTCKQCPFPRMCMCVSWIIKKKNKKKGGKRVYTGIREREAVDWIKTRFIIYGKRESSADWRDITSQFNGPRCANVCLPTWWHKALRWLCFCRCAATFCFVFDLCLMSLLLR